MRHSIKRISKSALSVILALMMVVSTMAVGITTFNAATISATIYIDCTNQSGYTPNIWVWDDSKNYTGGNWPGKAMTQVSGNIYKYTFDVDDSKVDQVKVIFSFNGRRTSNITLKDAAGSDWATNSMIFTLNSGDSGNYTGTWSPYSGGSGSNADYYVAGTKALVNAESEWQPADPSDKMTKNDDGTYSITYINLDPTSEDTYQFKITNGTWTNPVGFDSKKVTGNDKVKLSSVGNDSNIGIKFDDKSNVTITYNPTDGTVYVSATPVASDYTLTPSVIGLGTVTYTTGGSEITDFNQKFVSGTSITVNATPSTGYQLDSIKLNDTTINNGATFAMPSQDSTVVVTFSLKTPTVSLTPETASVNVGESVALTPSVTTNGLDATGVYTITKGDSTLNVADYIKDSTFTTPKTADSVGTYVVTYTATVTSGSDTKSASASSTITVEQSEEQQAYNTLVTWLAESSKNPDNITGKTTSTLNTYKTAYTTAQTAVSAGYPTSGTANTTALSSLQSAYSALTEKTPLVKPELTALPQYIDLTSDSKTVSLSVSNASSYPAGANVTYSFYQEGNDTALYTGTNSSCTIDVATEGTFNYYVTINSYDTDNYTCADVTSEPKSVIAVTPVTVSVKAGANGKAYVSSYTTYDNQTKSNTDTAITSVKVAPNSNVTFTAVPDEGYVVGVWNTDQSSGSTTYTVANITTATNVTVSFSEKPKYTYALVGNGGAISDSNGNAVDWHGKDAATQADFALSYQSALKFTNNKLVVKVSGITDKNVAQFRFLGTDGTNYYHYGSNDNNNKAVASGSTYTTTQTNMAVYKFTENGTYEIEITSGTDSPMSFKVTKLATYYIGGRFKVKASEGATDFTYTATTSENNSQWNDKSKKIPFTYAGDGIYKLDTYCTIKELSEQISNNSPYFLIHDGTTKFVSNVSKMHDMEDHNESRKVTLKKFSSDTTDDYLLFSDTSSTDTSLVTLYLDTTGTNLQIYYVAESGKTALDAPSITTNVESLSTEKPTATITVTPADTYPKGMAVEYYLYNGGTYVNKTAGTTFTVTSAGTYTVKAYPPADNPDYKESVDSNSVVISDVRTPVVLEAMHGIKNGEAYTGTTVAEAANTSSSVVENTSANLAGGIQYTVTKGSTVKLTTTMVADTTTAEKFVYAYVVNNKDTYLATEGIAATGEGDKKYATYSATFTIAEDATDTTFTVVPIYYYKACGKDGEYIKFYVNAKESTWPNVYNYAYYYGASGTKDEDTKESDGEWPGQPMLYDSTKQLFYSLVPKSINNQTVSGLTVNNNGSEQTYDFDDFKYIYLSGYDIVRLDLKYKSGHGNTVKDSGNGVNKLAIGASYTTEGTFANPTNGITVSTFDGRWEAFNDINGKPMSLLGKETTDTTNKVYIVSTALYNISGRGQYMTAWYVYKADSNGNLTFVTAACPSDFVPRPYSGTQTEKGVNTTAYNTILDAGLGNAPVQIVYEDVQFKSTKDRFDGRWYYAQSDSEVSAYAYYRTYETTDCSGTPSELLINKDYSKIIAETELINDDGIVIGGKNSTLKKEISVVSSPLAGYIFDHWSVVDKAGNIIIDKLENVGSSFTTTLDQEIHYVANFRKATQGQIEIKHSKYSGVGAKNGLGYYRLEVKVLKENGTWTSVATGSGTGANGHTVTISDLAENDKIVRIKLITETAGENTFRYWYTDSSDGTEIIEDPDGDMTWNGTATSEPYGKNGILTYTFDTEVWKLFSGKISQLNFYSDIAPMNKNYKLTYIYDDRFGNPKSYVVTGTHDDSYYVQNDNSWAPSDQLIADCAPSIDDLYKDCKWVITNSNKDGTDATLTAVQTSKKYTVKIYDSTGEASDPYLLPINSYVYVNNVPGQFYVADPEDSNGNKFNYWSVTENGIEVTRQYQRMYTLVVLGNYDIKPVYGEEAATDAVYISKPQYTREQTKSEDGKIVTDKLYVDFMVSYMSADGSLIMNNTGKYDTGILIEFGQYRKFEENEDKTLNIDYAGKAYNSDNSKLVEAATGTASKVKYTYSGEGSIENDNRVIYKYDIDEEKYNNMNRLDYFASFVNSPGNQKYVYKAYYYVRVKNADGSYGEPIISNAVYFNLYEVGTSDPKTVNTSAT